MSQFCTKTLTSLLEEAKIRALRDGHNVAITIDGALLKTDRHRPDQVPERLGILQYYEHLNGNQPGVVLCTYSDQVREAWRTVRDGAPSAV